MTCEQEARWCALPPVVCISVCCTFVLSFIFSGVLFAAAASEDEGAFLLAAAAAEQRKPGQIVLPKSSLSVPGQTAMPGVRTPASVAPKTSAPKTVSAPASAPKIAVSVPVVAVPVAPTPVDVPPPVAPVVPKVADAPATAVPERTEDGNATKEAAGSESASGGAQPLAQPISQEKDKWEQQQGGAARVNLFGTIEFRSKLKDTPQWERVIAEEKKKPGLDNPRGLAAGWPTLREKLKTQPLQEQLTEVNKFFNRFPYRLDIEAYGVQDYWATPAEFMSKSGDCEDFSIIKYYALKQLGVSPDSMRIVVLMDSIRNLAHAVLAVYTDGQAYILDNVSNLVLPHTRLTHYKPQFSVNENFRWMHMVPKKNNG